MVFETKRLRIRFLKETDKDLFFKMMNNPKVMHPIPLEVLSRKESDKKFNEIISQENSRLKNIWAITPKTENEFMGICGLLKNNEQDDEIAYRFNEAHWGQGYGTEIAEGLINYCFEKMNSDKVTADVNIINKKSVRILEKFMTPIKEFYNKKDQCTDRRYALNKIAYNNKK